MHKFLRIAKNIPFLLRQTQLLDYFGFRKDSVYTFQLESYDGHPSQIDILPELVQSTDLLAVRTPAKPLYLQNPQMPYWGKYIPEDSIYYAQYNRCIDVDTNSFENFTGNIFAAVRQGKAKKLIFDMQFNPGGASYQGTRFIRKLAKTSINRRGKLFVVIGRRTFSSAIINTYDFKRYTHALLIGEETSARPNHYGDIKRLKLPTSGVEINYSTKFFELDKNHPDAKTVRPDMLVERSFADYLNGVDPVYEYIKNYFH